MKLRASYPERIKRGTLVHELGHRYLSAMGRYRAGLSEHQALNLLLLQVWVALWGSEFVAAQIKAESQWTESYRSAWQWALSLSEAQRSELWRSLLAGNRHPTMGSSRPLRKCFK